jgi:endonuclease G
MQNFRFRYTNRAVYTVLIVLCIAGFWLFENFYSPIWHTSAEVTAPGKGIPHFIEPSYTTGMAIKHQYFWLSYREEYEQAEWVAYTLEPSHLTTDERKRPYFMEDPYILT